MAMFDWLRKSPKPADAIGSSPATAYFVLAVDELNASI